MTTDRTPPPFKPTRTEVFQYICLSCGSNGETLFRLREDGLPYTTVKCPKCSNKAILLGLHGMGVFMLEMVKRLKAVESDVFDLSASSDGEER
jgi:DNA-directed RNA polymerase subunit RPC12/RpoP